MNFMFNMQIEYWKVALGGKLVFETKRGMNFNVSFFVAQASICVLVQKSIKLLPFLVRVSGIDLMDFT